MLLVMSVRTVKRYAQLVEYALYKWILFYIKVGDQLFSVQIGLLYKFCNLCTTFKMTLNLLINVCLSMFCFLQHFPSDMRYISLFPVMSCTNVKVLERQGASLFCLSEKKGT